MCLSVHLSITKTLTLSITFELLEVGFKPLEVGLSYFTCKFLVARPLYSHSYQNFDLWPWPRPLTYIFENCNICHSFWTINGRDFIFHKYIPCDLSFWFIPKVLTFWHWQWPLTYISENFNICRSFRTITGRAFIFLITSFVMRLPFQWHQIL